jgi:hypothetical protein
MMEKKRLLIILVTVVCLSLISGCTPSASAVQKAIEQTQAIQGQIQTAVAQTQAANAQQTPVEIQQQESQQESVAHSTPIEEPPPTAEPTPTIKPTDRPKTISLGVAKSISSCCQITISDIYFDKVIKPSSPGNWYRYYETKSSDTIYLDIVMSIKNLSSMVKAADDFVNVSIEYDKQYDYDAFAVVEYSDGSDFTYANITGIDPLLTAKVHFLIEVPSTMEKSGKSLLVIIKVAGDEYQYQYR